MEFIIIFQNSPSDGDSWGRVVGQEVRGSDILIILHVDVSALWEEKFNNLKIVSVDKNRW